MQNKTSVQYFKEMHRSQTICDRSTEIKLVKPVQRPSAPEDYTLSESFLSENYRNFEFNGRLYSSVWPRNNDLLSEQELDELKEAPWFQAGLPRKISLDILLQQPPGSFLVRQSESHKKCFVLSLRVPPLEPPKLAHYLIEKPRRGFIIKGFSKEFSSIKSLIVHHSVLKEQLPTPLLLPRPQHLMIRNLIHKEALEGENDKLESPTTKCCGRISKEK